MMETCARWTIAALKQDVFSLPWIVLMQILVPMTVATL